MTTDRYAALRADLSGRLDALAAEMDRAIVRTIDIDRLPQMRRDVADVRAAAEIVRSSRDLLDQIRKGNLVDDHGHIFAMNVAYIKAVELAAQERP